MPMIAASPTTPHIATSPAVQVLVFVFLTVGMNKLAINTMPNTREIIPAIKFAIISPAIFFIYLFKNYSV